MKHTRQKWGWAWYDWANSAFSTTVMAGFFPVFFKEYWNAGLEVTESTFRLGLANSLASLVIVMMAPVLGAIADCMSRRKAMLLAFAFLGMLMTGGLYLAARGDWLTAAFLYVFAVIGFSGSNVFYDSLLPFVSDDTDVDRTSALGFSLGPDVIDLILGNTPKSILCHLPSMVSTERPGSGMILSGIPQMALSGC